MTPNFITVVHKFIRSELFGVSLALSACDPTDTDALTTVAARLERVTGLLQTHAEKEDEGFLPLLRDGNPEAAARMERDHHDLDARMMRVNEAAKKLPTMDALLRESAVLLVYLDWNAFVSAYLAHLDDEECALFPLMGDVVPGVEALAATPLQMPPEVRKAFLEGLWKAVSPRERHAIEAAMTKVNTVSVAA